MHDYVVGRGETVIGQNWADDDGHQLDVITYDGPDDKDNVLRAWLPFTATMDRSVNAWRSLEAYAAAEGYDGVPFRVTVLGPDAVLPD